MGTGWNSRARCGQFAFVVLLALLSFSSASQAQSNAWDIAVLDKILASVPPGQTLAQVGDMFIKVSVLQASRSQLAGGPHPLLAFDGTTPTWTGGNVYYTFS